MKRFDSDGNPYPSTTSSDRYKDGEGGVSWSNYMGTKDKHDVAATQLNSKKNGEHIFYSPASGRQGAAFDERKKEKK